MNFFKKIFNLDSFGKIKNKEITSENPDDRDLKGNATCNWSSHGIMVGDVGNIYYFYCRDCGEKSIESYWDCF